MEGTADMLDEAVITAYQTTYVPSIRIFEICERAQTATFGGLA